MHFGFTDDQLMISETARAFFARGASSERVRAAMSGPEGIDRPLWNAFAGELGLAGLIICDRFEGAGLGMIELAIVAEAAGYHVAPLPVLASMALAGPALSAGGDGEQQAHWLPRLARGKAIGTLVIAENLSIEGDRLSGTVERVPHGAASDLILLCVGEACLLVEPGAEGVEITPLITMDQTRPFARLTLEGARFGRLADGAAARAAAFRTGCVAVAADALGGAQACLDRTVVYAKERIQFGRPIGSFQAVKHRLADMAVEIEQTRSAVYWAASALDEAAGDAAIALHSAKAIASETYAFCAGNMIQLHGGIGFTWEHDAHLFFKRAQANRTMLRTPEWHRERLANLVLEAST